MGGRAQAARGCGGTRALIEVLLLHRHLAHERVVAGMAAALAVGALTADAVALEARKTAQAEADQQAEVARLPPLPGPTGRRAWRGWTHRGWPR